MPRRGIISAGLKVNVANDEMQAHPTMPWPKKCLPVRPSARPPGRHSTCITDCGRRRKELHHTSPSSSSSSTPLAPPQIPNDGDDDDGGGRQRTTDRPRPRPSATVKQAGGGRDTRTPARYLSSEQRTCPSGRLPPMPLPPSPPSPPFPSPPPGRFSSSRPPPGAGAAAHVRVAACQAPAAKLIQLLFGKGARNTEANEEKIVWE